MTKHFARIVHKPKRSHHKKAVPEKVSVNLARPAVVALPSPLVLVETDFPKDLYREANAMLAAGNPDAARLGLWFLREYRMAHKFWSCA